MSVIITDINKSKSDLPGEDIKTREEIGPHEGKEVTLEIRKSKVDKLAGLLGDIDIDSVELHSTEQKKSCQRKAYHIDKNVEQRALLEG